MINLRCMGKHQILLLRKVLEEQIGELFRILLPEGLHLALDEVDGKGKLLLVFRGLPSKQTNRIKTSNHKIFQPTTSLTGPEALPSPFSPPRHRSG